MAALGRAVACCLSLLLHLPVAAQGSELLTEFVDTHDSGSLSFHQESFDEEGALLSESRGQLSFVRPDKFRLEYLEPFPQLILGDGEKIWYYDRDLGQATVHDFDNLSKHSALSLLTGGKIQKDFILTATPGRDSSHHWVHAVPVAQERTFEDIWIAFERGRGALSVMEIVDVFSNKMVLRFSAISDDVAPGVFRADFPADTVVLDGDG